MSRTFKTSESSFEKETIYLKKPSKLSHIKQILVDTTQKYNRSSKNASNIVNSLSKIKKVEINLHKNSHYLEVESVGEEGTAQVIRSPIVKRGKSVSSSFDDLKAGHEKPSDLIENHAHKLTLENISLKQELDFAKEQIKAYQKSISDLSSKYEKARNETNDLEEKITQVLIENRRILEENEKMNAMIKYFETSRESCGKNYLQEALEAKILSIDQDREEKAEKYQKIITKYVNCLQEFLACQEWISNLCSSRYPLKDLKDCEESIKNRIDRLQLEVVYYQSQAHNDKVYEKSYCTSISSSVSAFYSPTKTIRNTNFFDLISPLHQENN